MFQDMIDCSLPERTENLRAMFRGGREPAIFVRFETDSEGIEYVLKTFDKSGLRTKKINADSKLSNIIFLSPFSWQKEIGVEMFDLDKDPVESGFKIENNPHTAPNFELVIDSQRNTVYIFVYYT
jgi:hypothetical protein